MADKADGSLVFETDLDNDGFEKGSNKLLSSVESLTQAVNKMGASMQQSFSGITAILQNMSAASQQSATAATDQATQAAEAASNAQQSATSATNQVAEAGTAASNAQQSAASASNQAAQAAETASKAQEDAASTTQQATQATGQYDKELAKLQRQIDSAKTKLADYYQALDQIHDSTDESLKLSESSEQTERLLEIEQIQIEQLNEKYQSKLALLQQLEERYAQVAAAREAAVQNAMNQSAETTPAIPAESGAAEDVRDTAEAEEEVIQKTGAMSGALQMLHSILGSVGSAAQTLGVRTLEALHGVLTRVGSAALSAGKKLAKMSFSAIANGAKKAISSLRRFASQSQQTTGATQGLVKALTSLKTILISRIKRMFISAIFKNVQEGLQALQQYSSQFKATMDQLKGSATQAGGNVSVLLSNIISTFAPFVNSLISMLSRAMVYVNSFFALLSGKQTVTVAKAAQNTENLADSTKKAAQAQKKFNAELYSFDELNRQSKNNSNDNNDATNTANAPAMQFEEIPIDLPQSVLDWVDRLKDAWKKGDWYGLGQIAAEGLNAGMKVVDDWINNTFRPLGVKWAGRIAQILNGLTDGFDGELLGKTVADALNAVADIYNTFMDTYDWEKLGTKIGDAINGLVDNIEWDNIGKAFAQKWQALIDVIYGIVHRVKWAELGSGIGTAVQNWFSSIDWVKAANALVTGFNGVITAIRSFIQSINWREAGRTLGKSLETIISGIDWGNLVGLLLDAVKALFDAIVGFLEGIGPELILAAIMGLVAIIAGKIAIATLLAPILTAIGTVMAQIVAAVVAAIAGWPALLIAAAAAALVALIIWMKNGGAEVVAGFFQGIADAMKNAATWLKEHLVDPVINAVMKFFRIGSPSKVFAEIGMYLIQGLFDGISKTWGKITGFFSKNLESLRTSINAAWGKIKTAASTAWEKIKTAVTTPFSNLKNAVEKTASTLKTNLTNTWNGIKTNASNAWNNLSQTASTSFSKVTSGISTAWGKLKTSLGNIKWSGIGEMMVAGIWNGISGKWSGLVNYVTGQINSFVQKVKDTLGIHSPSKVFAGIGENLDAGLEQGLEDGKPGLLTTASNIASAVTEGMTPDSPEMEMTANGVVVGLNAVLEGLSDIAVTFRAIADALTTAGGFTMPQIAEGTVVPYRTRVESETPQDDSEGTTAYLLGILSELQALSRIIRNGEGGQDGDIKIIIGGKEVFDVVVEENDRAIRRTGRSPLKMRT